MAVRLQLLCQSVRQLHRLAPRPGKPPCLPPAKGKRYRAVEVPWQDAEDVKELLWRRHLYMSALKSIKAHFKKAVEIEEAEALHRATAYESLPDMEDPYFLGKLAETEAENQRIAEKRQLREQEELKQLEQNIFRETDEYLKAQKRLEQQSRAEVNRLVAASTDFVTAENLERKILDALENPVDHGFAIDTQGNKYTGNTFIKYLTDTPLESKSIGLRTAPANKTGQFEAKQSAQQ